MTDLPVSPQKPFDRINAAVAGAVFLLSFIVYAMTVQRSFSFWDCGEFIACAVIQGIPHPPGTPLLMVLGRVLSLIPFVEDISHRVNYVSVVSSAVTALFSYVLAAKAIRYFFADDPDALLNRLITYVGAASAGLFVAFSSTNWGNSVEAEAYGLALALSVAIVWLTVKFWEERGTKPAAVYLVLAMYLAMLGLGVHMTVFLVVPVCAIIFILDRSARWYHYAAICAFAVMELLLVLIFADGRGGSQAFMAVSGFLGIGLVVLLYRKISWGILIAIAACSTVMLSFRTYLTLALPISIVLIALMGVLSKRYGWKVQWKTAMAVLVAGFIGYSIHYWIPIRSSHSPRIDENNCSIGWDGPADYLFGSDTYLNFLDRKQYGQESMVERMFHRRGEMENQFGRHAHMGFWSYFEEQYSRWTHWGFAPFFLLGVLGMVVLIWKRLELGLPYLTLFLLCTVGLILYMNFADGTRYSWNSGDAYLEVRNRDYFFTPAFVFFGIAMGLGVAALMNIVKEQLSGSAVQKLAVQASAALVLLPGITLAHNWHQNDRSQNLLPYYYAKNLLDSCEPNAILFTGGDNDTFPVWCLQEAYNYRKDIRCVNLSLLNTDWYVEQMKERFNVPISLTREQIRWTEPDERSGLSRPSKPFYDEPRKRTTFLVNSMWNGVPVRVADMMTDEIVLRNGFKDPVYFSAPPYAESPLRLVDHAVHVAQVFRLELEPGERLIDVDKGFELYTQVYKYDGYENADVFRDDNATGVGMGLVMTATRLYDELLYLKDTTRAVALYQTFIDRYPEFWQPYMAVSEIKLAQGDTAAALELWTRLHDTLTSFVESNPNNQYYLQDLGGAKFDLGRWHDDQAMMEEGLALGRRGFYIDPNNNYAFRKLIALLSQAGKFTEMQQVARDHARYKRNLSDPYVQRLLGIQVPGGTPLQRAPGQ